jgi:hypothetical protein
VPNKIKETQPEKPEEVQGRDLFQTPNYATELLVPFIPDGLIWECACGNHKITDVLRQHGREVFETDLRTGFNFLKDSAPESLKNFTIVTNPPFSLKRRFYNRCLEYGVSFALLIPADYSGWVIDSLRYDRAEKIIPTRRIDYLTPTGLSGATGHTSNFHSLWLTRGFGLGNSEVFVELTNKMKENI